MNKPAANPPKNTSNAPPKIPAAALLVLGSADLSNSINEIKKERVEVFKEEKFTIGDFDFSSYNSPLPAVESVIKYNNSTNFRGNAEVPEVRPGIPIRTMMKIKSNLIPGAGNLLQSLTVDSKYIILVGTFLNKTGGDNNFSSYNSSLLFEKKIVLPSKPVDIKITPAIGDSVSLTGIIVDYKVFTVRSEKTYYSITVLYSKLPIRQKLKPIPLAEVTSPSSTEQVSAIQPTTQSTPESTSESTSESTPGSTPGSTPESTPESTPDTAQTFETANKNLKDAKILKDKSIQLISSKPAEAIELLKKAINLLNDNINKSALVNDSKIELSKCYELLGKAYYNLYKTTRKNEDLTAAKDYLDKLTNKPADVERLLKTIEGILNASKKQDLTNKLLEEAKKLQNQSKLNKLLEALTAANKSNDQNLINKVKTSLFDLWVQSTNIYISQKNKQQANLSLIEAKKYAVTQLQKQTLNNLQTKINKLYNSTRIPSNSEIPPITTLVKLPKLTSLSPNEIIQQSKEIYIEESNNVRKVNSPSNKSSITKLEISIQNLRNLIPSNTNRKEEIITLIDNSYRVISEIYLLLAIKNSYDINYINKAKEAFDKMSKKDEALQRKIEQYKQVHTTRNQSPRKDQTPGSNNRVPIANDPLTTSKGMAETLQRGSLNQEILARFRIDEAKKIIDTTYHNIAIVILVSNEGKYSVKYWGKPNSTIDKSILDAEKAITILKENLVMNPFVNTFKRESAQLKNKCNFIIAKSYLLKALMTFDFDQRSKEVIAKTLRYLNIAVTYLDLVTYDANRVALFEDPVISEEFKTVNSYVKYYLIQNLRQKL